MKKAFKPIAGPVTVLICLFLSGPGFAYDEEEGAAPGDLGVEIGPGGQVRRETQYRAGAEDESPIHAHVRWSSRYVSEGRDNLDGKPLASLTSDVSVGNFTFAPWIGRGYDSAYSELNLNAIYGTQLAEDLELYAGYTHLKMHRLVTTPMTTKSVLNWFTRGWSQWICRARLTIRLNRTGPSTSCRCCGRTKSTMNFC